MKNLKKVCALVLSLAMIVSTFTVSFAAEDTKTDAEICEALGMLQGEGDGVTDEYLAKSTTRFQAALMFLRLQDLEEEALAFEGTETFEDAEDLQWVVGRSVLAYLKANPELGWVGTGKGFKPNDAISAQAYYKVMLEALGYKYGEDFEWAEVLEFAAEKGLVAAAEVENFTNNDIATVTVETLKAENSEGVKLINVLVEKEVITEELAKLVDYVAPVTATMVGAKAIDATTITVTFDEAVEVDADDFAVTAGDKEFAVSEVTSADAGKVAVLTVEELTVGSKYTVTNGEASKTVVPTIKDDKTKPAISGAEAITGAIVRVELNSRNLNKETLVAENFSLNNDANVINVKLDTEQMKKDGNENKTIVLMDVTGLKAGKAFVVTSNNVTSYEGAVADESKATFAGQDADDKAPKLAGAVSEAGYQVIVTFDEAVQLDEATATDISNYTITPELAVKDAKIEKNIVGGDTTVILTTDYQKSGVAYTLKAANISDGTNVMKETEKVVFAGKDKANNQVADSAVADDATKVTVTYKYEANETALDVANYSIDKDISVISAEYKEDTAQADGLNQKKVVLTTSEMKSGIAYTITVGTGVQDILGQGLKEAKKLTFAGKDKDASFSTSNSAKAINKNTIEVTFGEEVDYATATDVANYQISDLGYPSQVTLNSTAKVATLTVQDQTPGKSYTITINNVKDKAENIIKADTKVTFTGKGDVVDALKVTSAKALSKTIMKVSFNQTLKAEADIDESVFSLTASTGNDTYTFNNGAAVDAGKDYILLTVGTTELSSDKVYTVIAGTSSNLRGQYTNHDLNTEEANRKATFVGSDSTDMVFGIKDIIALDKTHIKVIFDEELVTSGNALDTTLKIWANSDYTGQAKNADDAIIEPASTLNVTPADVITDSNKAVIYTLQNEMDNSKVYYVELSNLSNFATVDTATLAPHTTGANTARHSMVTGTLSGAVDNTLDIESATMIDNNTLEVKFNADLKKDNTLLAGNYSKFVIANTSNGSAVLNAGYAEFIDQRTIRAYFDNDNTLTANSNGIYYFRVESGSGIVTKIGDFSGFASEKSYESFAVDTSTNAKPSIALVEPQTDTVVKVTLSERAYKFGGHNPLTASDFVLYNKDTNVIINSADITNVEQGSEADKVFYLTLSNGKFLSGANYQIGLGADVVGVDGYVKADEYSPTSDETKNSMNFGGTASASTTVAIQAATANAPVLRATGVLYKYDSANKTITKLVNDEEVKSFFTLTNVSTSGSGAISATTVKYTTANNDITFTLADQEDTDTIELASGSILTDAAGNKVTINKLTLTAGTPSTWQ